MIKQYWQAQKGIAKIDGKFRYSVAVYVAIAMKTKKEKTKIMQRSKN